MCYNIYIKNLIGVLMNLNRLVVVVIDMQKHFLKNVPKNDREKMINNQVAILRKCKKKNIPCIIVRFDKYAKTISQLTNVAYSLNRIFVVEKSRDNAFNNSLFVDILEILDCDSIFFFGVNASGCVWKTAATAKNKGYKIYTHKETIANDEQGFLSSDHPFVTWFTRMGVYFTNSNPSELF
ncbi:MAG: hypothetical protein LiPW41_704 [Parcubacteria group bacterium LiPW_41]|nr:MAG: hypothetical protein LiPW41_704 [Parcubacteria group bacterium LiPW_41]